MPASRLNWNESMTCTMLVAVTLFLSACAGNTMTQPNLPDERVLAPAEQALAKAREADADSFAPRAVDASRRRIATARDILYAAARAHRDLNDTERQRVDQLVAAAQLDARSALVQTQAKAVRRKLAELQGQTGSGSMARERAPQPEVAP